MIGFGYGLEAPGDVQDAGWLHGLKIAAGGRRVRGLGCPRLDADIRRAALAVAAHLSSSLADSTHAGADHHGGWYDRWRLPVLAS
jgi:hypothetical protein